MASSPGRARPVPNGVRHDDGNGTLEGSAYVTWLNSELSEQTRLLGKKDRDIEILQARLREATQQLAGRPGGDGADPEGFLIERIVDEEERNAQLEEELRKSAARTKELEREVAWYKDEARALGEALRVMKDERRDDIVRTHMEWATAHLVHNPDSLPIEAVGVLLDDLQARRADVLHVAQKLEDWYSSLSSHHFTAMQHQQRHPRRGTNGITSYTAEIKKLSDVLFSRLRGEATTLTRNSIASMSQGHLAKCRSDTAAFSEAFRHTKSIILNLRDLRGSTPTDPNTTTWLPGELKVETAVGRLGEQWRTNLLEGVREMVLCYDTNPRSTQSSHGKLIEELSANLYTLVNALRVAQTPAAGAGAKDLQKFPVSLNDARPVNRTPRRPSSLGPAPSTRVSSPTMRGARVSSKQVASKVTTPRSISPFIRGGSISTTASKTLNPVGGVRRPSPSLSERGGSAGKSDKAPDKKVDKEKLGFSTSIPLHSVHRMMPSSSPLDARIESDPTVPPPTFQTPVRQSTVKIPSSGPTPHPAPVPTPVPIPVPTPTPKHIDLNKKPSTPRPSSSVTVLVQPESVYQPSIPQPQQVVTGKGREARLPTRREPPVFETAPPPQHVEPPMHIGRTLDDGVVSSENGNGVEADGFLTEAQRKEVKERAMGNFKGSEEVAEVQQTSRAAMMQELMQWSGQLNTKLANRGRQNNYSQEEWSDEDDGTVVGEYPEQEFDSPLNITHPDYNDPLVTPGASSLRNMSSSNLIRSVSFAEGTKANDGPDD